jgi:hypothetical protein
MVLQSALYFAEFGLVVADHIPEAFQAEFQFFLEVEFELHVFLTQQLDVPAVLLKFALELLQGLLEPSVVGLLQRGQLGVELNRTDLLRLLLSLGDLRQFLFGGELVEFLGAVLRERIEGGSAVVGEYVLGDVLALLPEVVRRRPAPRLPLRLLHPLHELAPQLVALLRHRIHHFALQLPVHCF